MEPILKSMALIHIFDVNDPELNKQKLDRLRSFLEAYLHQLAGSDAHDQA